jgi:hypothetical protein
MATFKNEANFQKRPEQRTKLAHPHGIVVVFSGNMSVLIFFLLLSHNTRDWEFKRENIYFAHGSGCWEFQGHGGSMVSILKLCHNVVKGERANGCPKKRENMRSKLTL